MLIMFKDDKEKARVSGAMNPAQLAQWVRQNQ
jgi:hypothetical protein